MAKSESDKPDDLPRRDRSKAAERMAQRRGDDKAIGWEVGNEGRPGHPDGWQPGGRGDDNR